MKTKTNVVEYTIMKKLENGKYFYHKLKTLREAEKVARRGIREHGFDKVNVCRMRLYESSIKLYGQKLRSWESDGFFKTIYKKK
tara:strand:+ start:19374 stop:19625 length:252 start_codon:yes stop_codon:yes gene_type:complete